MPGCNLYIWKIPKDWDELELARRFDHYGDIVSCTIMREQNGDSRGFGFIGFTEADSVRKAILGMDGLPVGPPLELPGKMLSVSPLKGEEHLMAEFPDCYPPAGEYGSEPQGKRTVPGANLYIFNIPPWWKDMDLYRHFIHYGAVTSVKVMMKDDGKENRGFGFVGFVDPISAQRGIAGMHNLLLDAEDMSKRMQVRIKKGEEKAGDECREALAMKDPYHPGYGADRLT